MKSQQDEMSPSTVRAGRVYMVVVFVILCAIGGLTIRSLRSPDRDTASSHPSADRSEPAHAPAEAGIAASTAEVLGSTKRIDIKPSHPDLDSGADLLRKVQFGLDGNPQQALVAAQILQSCSLAEKQTEAYYQVRDRLSELTPEELKTFGLTNGFTKEQVNRMLSNQRRCQVFDATTMGRQGELFLKAYAGGAEGAALSYLSWMNLQSPRPTVEPALLARLQADTIAAAERGDLATLAAFAFYPKSAALELGADVVQTHAFKEAWFRILDEGAPGNSASNREYINQMSKLLPPEPPLTQAQQLAVDALVQRVVEAHARSSKESLTVR